MRGILCLYLLFDWGVESKTKPFHNQDRQCSWHGQRCGPSSLVDFRKNHCGLPWAARSSSDLFSLSVIWPSKSALRLCTSLSSLSKLWSTLSGQVLCDAISSKQYYRTSTACQIYLHWTRRKDCRRNSLWSVRFFRCVLFSLRCAKHLPELHEKVISVGDRARGSKIWNFLETSTLATEQHSGSLIATLRITVSASDRILRLCNLYFPKMTQSLSQLLFFQERAHFACNLVKTEDVLLTRALILRLSCYPIHDAGRLCCHIELPVTVTETQHTHSLDLTSTLFALLIALNDTSKDSCNDELSCFIRTVSGGSHDVDPFLWWKGHAHRFPTLLLKACDTLSIQMSSFSYKRCLWEKNLSWSTIAHAWQMKRYAQKCVYKAGLDCPRSIIRPNCFVKFCTARLY